MKRIRGFRHRALVGCATALTVAVMGLVGDASAQFPQLIPTKIGLVKFGGSPAVGRLYKIVSKAPNPPIFALPIADPAGTGGTLTATIGSGTLSCTFAAQSFDGSEGWKTLGPASSPKGYKYINKLAPAGTAGPCKIVIVKEKVIKTIVKGTGTLPVPLDPGLNPDVSTVLDLGGDKYCAYAVAPHFKEKADRFIKAKSQAAPVACPGGPTTTTTLTGTTTTTGGATTTTTGGGTTTTTVAGTTTTTTTLPPPPLDHYRLYATDEGPDGPLVHLEDQFQVQDVDLGPVLYFMPPVSKNFEPVFDPAAHQTCYWIQGGSFEAGALIDNQFGLQELRIDDPAALCVPTEKYPAGPALPLLRDHYKCYHATPGHPLQAPPVLLQDQFQVEEVILGDPFLFCNPVDKNGEGILNPLDHLTCYFTAPMSGVYPGLIPIRNQFHEEVVELFNAYALCVPSIKLEWWLPTTTTTEPQTTSTTTVQQTTTTTTFLPEPCEFFMPPMCGMGWCPFPEVCMDMGGMCMCIPPQ